MADRLFVTYKRKDGVGLSGTIYLPVGYQKGQVAQSLHERDWRLTPAVADAGLCDFRRSDHADRGTGRDGQR